LTNTVEEVTNINETQYEGKVISFENLYFQKLRLYFIEAICDFQKN